MYVCMLQLTIFAMLKRCLVDIHPTIGITDGLPQQHIQWAHWGCGMHELKLENKTIFMPHCWAKSKLVTAWSKFLSWLSMYQNTYWKGLSSVLIHYFKNCLFIYSVHFHQIPLEVDFDIFPVNNFE